MPTPFIPNRPIIQEQYVNSVICSVESKPETVMVVAAARVRVASRAYVRKVVQTVDTYTMGPREGGGEVTFEGVRYNALICATTVSGVSLTNV